MSKAPQVIHMCNHTVVDDVSLYGIIEINRSQIEGSPDEIPKNINMKRIDKVMSYDKKRVFTKGVEYNQNVSSNIIEWTNNDNVPKPGEKYLIQGHYIKTTMTKYKPNECKRCAGNGWYVDIFGGETVNSVSGADNLIQNIVKILFTEKQDDEDYGSRISSIIGKNVYNNIQLSADIADAISDCEQQIKDSQSSAIANGVSIPEDEMLDSLSVEKITFSEETQTCYLTVKIINSSKQFVLFTFKI